MEKTKLYVLPKLPYEYDSLKPSISEEQLRIHHQKHHQAYVNGANAIFDKIDKARKDGLDIDAKATLKEFSFQIGGHILHSIFWPNMAPTGEGGGRPGSRLGDVIDKEFGSFDRFKKEFTQAASSVEGSGWAALSLDKTTGRPLIMQIEKHNVNIYPTLGVLMVLDVWEHAYYLDYKNERAKFIEAFWNVVNWDEADKRLGEVM